MLTLKDWLECIDYKISEGSAFGWPCFPNAYVLDYWDGSKASASVVYNTESYEVLYCEVCDYLENRAYRFFNGDNESILKTFVKDNNKLDVAWGGIDSIEPAVMFADLEVKEDFLEKCSAIVKHQPYSTDISVPLNLDDSTLLELMKIAHARNITLNQLVNSILEELVV